MDWRNFEEIHGKDQGSPSLVFSILTRFYPNKNSSGIDRLISPSLNITNYCKFEFSFSESDLDLELEECEERPPEYHEVQHCAVPDHKETAI